MKFLGLFFILFGLVFGGIGGSLALTQHRKIVSYLPVEATVISSRVVVRRSSKSTSYAPAVVYRFTAKGRDWQGRDVFPIGQSGSRSWAAGVAASYRAGRKTQAYYDPANPVNSFLIRHYSFFPYIFFLLGMGFSSAGVAILIGRGSPAKKPAQPIEGVSGWYEVAATSTIADRRRAALIGTILWGALGVASIGHYFFCAEPPYETTAYVFSSIYGAVGCVGVGLFLYYLFLGRNVSDARFYVTAPKFALGGTATIGVQQEVRRTVQVIEGKIGLVLVESRKERRGSKTTYVTSKVWEEWVSPVENREIVAGDTIKMSWTVTLPTDQPPSTTPSQKGYPRHLWRFEVIVRLAGSPDYRARFPIIVEPASEATGVGENRRAEERPA